MSATAAEKIVNLGFEKHENDMPRDDWERLSAMSDEDLERLIALGLLGSGSDPKELVETADAPAAMDLAAGTQVGRIAR